MYQFQFFISRQGLDFQFPPEGCGFVRTCFFIHKLQRAPASGVLGTLTAAVFFQPPGNIRCDAGIQASVTASEDIQFPRFFHIITEKGRNPGPFII